MIVPLAKDPVTNPTQSPSLARKKREDSPRGSPFILGMRSTHDLRPCVEEHEIDVAQDSRKSTGLWTVVVAEQAGVC